MKIVQSFWTRPFLANRPDAVGHRLNGGWPHRLLNYCSCALSCLQLLKFYRQVELYTDAAGKEILIDKLQLPYTRVHVVLDNINLYHSRLWALGKLYTYSLQQEPFLHVDNDVYIWKAFDHDLMNCGLIAQNLEIEAGGYHQMVKQMCRELDFVPAYVSSCDEKEFLTYCNAGILGGTDTNFFTSYVREAFHFLDGNMQKLTRLIDEDRIGDVNAIYEQVIFYQYALHLKKRISYLFPESFYIPKGIGYFPGMINSSGYVHSLGFYKYEASVYTQLENYLKEEYPEYYQRITGMIAIAEL